ncbi:MAG: ABC transporter permease [Pirellulales bacterium]|nr:ABC transporter permease [Pirellulales bacterium]
MTFAWLRTWKLGTKSVMLHPMRSLLTVLGILVGVSSVIWLLAIGEGISVKAQEQIASLGADNVIVRTVRPSNDATQGIEGPLPYGLTREDFSTIKKSVPTLERTVRIREVRQRFSYSTRSFEGRLVGCDPEFAEINQLKVDKGEFISDYHNGNQDNVCVLAATTAQRLFGYMDPLGETVKVEELRFRVIGVMQPRAASGGIGGSLAAQDFNLDIYIPIESLWQYVGDFVAQRGAGNLNTEIVELSQLTLRVDDVDNVMRTAALIEETLARRHTKMEDYAVVVPLELLEQARTTRIMFMVFMGLIAAISLLVGGIGIMNIMLATVTERTREIGIRRALGAKQRDITRQFLVETIVLSVAGGATGVIGGFLCGPVVSLARAGLERFFPNAISTLPEVMRDVEPIIIPWSIPLAFGISVAIGVVFGLYPARRAASMDPVDALRHE